MNINLYSGSYNNFNLYAQMIAARGGDEADQASAAESAGASGLSGAAGADKTDDSGQCQTCKNRKYVDGSNDPGVSFKTPSKISGNSAATAVLAHERQHVSRERAGAARQDRVVLSQSVTLHNSICPECGKIYVSGGVTRTTTANAAETQAIEVYAQDDEAKTGMNVNMRV